MRDFNSVLRARVVTLLAGILKGKEKFNSLNKIFLDENAVRTKYCVHVWSSKCSTKSCNKENLANSYNLWPTDSTCERY